MDEATIDIIRFPFAIDPGAEKKVLPSSNIGIVTFEVMIPTLIWNNGQPLSDNSWSIALYNAFHGLEILDTYDKSGEFELL